MLFALGAATAALDAVSSLTSSSASSSSSSSPPSTGFSAVDPFEIASPASASTSSAPASGLGSGSPISPATLNALLAAQSQSSTGSASRQRVQCVAGSFLADRQRRRIQRLHGIIIILQFAGKAASATDESDVVLRSPAIVQRLRQDSFAATRNAASTTATRRGKAARPPCRRRARWRGRPHWPRPCLVR